MIKADSCIGALVAELDYIEGERLLLVKELFETLLSANCRKLVVKYLALVDRKEKDWQPEDKNLYFAMVLLKTGTLAVRDQLFPEGLDCFNLGLKYMKEMESEGVFSSPDETLKKKTFFELLFSIANCCYEEKVEDQAAFFNSQVESNHPGPVLH